MSQSITRPGARRVASLQQTLQAIEDADHPLQTIDLRPLSDLTTAELVAFQATWRILDQDRRRSLISALLELAEDRTDTYFNAIYRWLIEDPDPWVRTQAIDGLWEDEDVRLIGPLIRLLRSDPSSEVRAASALSLGRFILLGELDQIDQSAASRVESTLLAAYAANELDTTVRRRLLEALAYSGREDVQDLILDAYRDDDEAMRISALFSMGRNADQRWKDYVLAELASDNSAMRFEAARASGELELAEAVPDLYNMLSEDDVELRDSAVWALGRIGGPAARRALQACRTSGDAELREAAEEALAEMDFLAGDADLPAFLFKP